MLISSIDQPAQWTSFATSPILIESLTWIKNNAASVSPGIHELGKPGWVVNVHGYTTAPPLQCTWENHGVTVDVQYMIEGVEAIDVADVASLGAPTLSKPASDAELFADPGVPVTQVIMHPGTFVVLMPGEAHRPKVAVNGPAPLRKLVVKIPLDLLVER